MVWKLDQLGRSLKDMVMLVTGFQEKGVHFVSLHDHLDTTTAQGRLMFNLFASLAEFERDIIRERTKAGLTAARGTSSKRAVLHAKPFGSALSKRISFLITVAYTVGNNH